MAIHASSGEKAQLNMKFYLDAVLGRRFEHFFVRHSSSSNRPTLQYKFLSRKIKILPKNGTNALAKKSQHLMSESRGITKLLFRYA